MGTIIEKFDNILGKITRIQTVNCTKKPRNAQVSHISADFFRKNANNSHVNRRKILKREKLLRKSKWLHLMKCLDRLLIINYLLSISVVPSVFIYFSQPDQPGLKFQRPKSFSINNDTVYF